MRPAWGSETHARVFAESTKIPNLKAYKNFRPAEGQFRFLIFKKRSVRDRGPQGTEPEPKPEPEPESEPEPEPDSRDKQET